MSTTQAQCQALVNAVAAIAAQYISDESHVSGLCYREHQQQVVNSGSTTTIDLTDASGGALTPTVTDQTAITAAVPVARLLANSAFLRSTIRVLAVGAAKQLDALVCNLAANFTTNPPLGAQGMAISDTNICTAGAMLDAAPVPAADPRYLVQDTGNYPNLCVPVR